MNRRVLSLLFCVSLLLASGAARADAVDVSVGAAPDDYLLVSVGDASLADLRLNGVRYQPEQSGKGLVRVTTGDLLAVAALEDNPALLTDNGLTMEDVSLSEGTLHTGSGAASGQADASAAASIPPNADDYLETLERILAQQQCVLAALREEDFAAASDVQASLTQLERLTADMDSLQKTLSSLLKRAALTSAGEARQQAMESTLLFIKVRLPDAARDTLLWLSSNGGASSGVQSGQGSAALNALREKVASLDAVQTLGGLLEQAQALAVSNANALREKTALANQAIAASAAELPQRDYVLADGRGLRASFTVEATVRLPASLPEKPSKALAQLLNPADGVKRLGMKNDGTEAGTSADLAADASLTTVSPGGALAASSVLTLGEQGSPVLGEPVAEPETLHAAPNARLYRKGKLTLTLDTADYAPGKALTLTATLRNEGKSPVAFCLTQAALDGVAFPLNAAKPVTVEAGQSAACTVSTFANAEKALALAGDVAPKELCVESLLIADGKTVQALSDPIPLFDGQGIAAAFQPTGAPLFDDNHLRVYPLAYSPASGKALLLLEATKGAAWESVAVDAVYDGCRAAESQLFRLQAGMKAFCFLSVAADCPWLGTASVDGIQLYLTFRHGNKQRAPYEIALGTPSSSAASADASQPVWRWGGCEARYLGVNESAFADGDGLLFEVKNNTAEIVTLLCTNRYFYLDGQRYGASEYNVACYPGAVSRVVIAPESLDAARLSEAREAAFRLSLYRQEGWYLREFARSEGLTLDLR